MFWSRAVVRMMPYATMIPQVLIPANATVAGPAGSNLQGIAMDGCGNLYLADSGDPRILQGPAGVMLCLWTSLPTSIRAATDLRR